MPHATLEKQREWARTYREKNRVRLRERDREWKRKNAAKNRAYCKEYRRLHPEKFKASQAKYRASGRAIHSQRKHRYGLTPEEYQRLHDSQKGICPACGRLMSEEALAIDHCHKTGAVRGIIHRRCNSMIGLARENPEILKLAAIYLQTHELRTNG